MPTSHNDMLDALRYMSEALVSPGGIPYVDWSSGSDTAYTTSRPDIWTQFERGPYWKQAKRTFVQCQRCHGWNDDSHRRCENCGSVIPQ